jgi:hypothetical protein
MTNALIKLCTEKDFAVIFARMAMQLRWLDADEAAIQSYYIALKDLPEELLHASAKRLANEPGRKYFPTTGEWREIALLIEQDKIRAELAGPRKWILECEQCEDTGWIYHVCTAHECGRHNPHIVPHNYVEKCFCRPTNRTFQRHHAKKPA